MFANTRSTVVLERQSGQSSVKPESVPLDFHRRPPIKELLGSALSDATFTPTRGQFRERSPFEIQIGWWGEIEDILRSLTGKKDPEVTSPRKIRDLIAEGNPLISLPSFRSEPEDLSAQMLRRNKLEAIARSETIEPIAGGLRLYKHEAPIQGLPRELEGLKILHLSDIHFHRSRLERVKEMKALADHLQGEQIDITAITGDIITDNEEDLNELALRVLDRLAPGSLRLYTFGNHDYYGGSQSYIAQALESLGFHNVTDKPLRLSVEGAPLNVYGIDDLLEGKPKAPQVRDSHSPETNLLLAHNLDAVRSNCPDVFDLVLSGHLHAGEVNFGVINGVDIMRLFGYAQNINQQRFGWDTLTDRALSFVSPGNVRHWFHFNVEKRGAALMTLTRADRLSD